MSRTPGQVSMSPATYDATVRALEAGGTPQALEGCPACVTLRRQNAHLREQVTGLKAEIKQLRMALAGRRDRARETRGGPGSD